MQKWFNAVECDANEFQVKNPSVKTSIDKQKGVRKNVQLKDHQCVDVITMFDQRTLSADSEAKLNEVVFNYHKHGVLFKNSMLFAMQFKIVQSDYIRNNTLQKLHHENTMIDYERGPCALFTKTECKAMFDRDLVEPAYMFLMPPVCTKKNKDQHHLAGVYCYNQLENCGWFLICLSVFFTMHDDVHEDFIFFVDESSDSNSK